MQEIHAHAVHEIGTTRRATPSGATTSQAIRRKRRIAKTLDSIDALIRQSQSTTLEHGCGEGEATGERVTRNSIRVGWMGGASARRWRFVSSLPVPSLHISSVSWLSLRPPFLACLAFWSNPGEGDPSQIVSSLAGEEREGGGRDQGSHE